MRALGTSTKDKIKRKTDERRKKLGIQRIQKMGMDETREGEGRTDGEEQIKGEKDEINEDKTDSALLRQ